MRSIDIHINNEKRCKVNNVDELFKNLTLYERKKIVDHVAVTMTDDLIKSVSKLK